MLSGIRVVKSFAREAFERNRFARHVESAYVTAMQRARVRALFVPLISLLGFTALALMLWYGGRQVVLGVITPGELIAFLFYMVMVAGPLESLPGCMRSCARPSSPGGGCLSSSMPCQSPSTYRAQSCPSG
jgi:subfamily B ATP-binding cassette protein MsbA